MYNRVILAGNLGRDPEMRYTPSGQAVANLSVATNEKWTDKDGNNQERTVWWRVAVWGKQAETCNQYLSKGRQVLVEGRMNSDDSGNPRTFQRKDGSWGASFEVTAQVVRFLGGRGVGGSQDGSAADYDAPPIASEDDIPF
ncbi:MAG: single-stranded DNA-binding protein [Anaerolineales bacterium]|jgi:single-strand DNA-binding protein|nr:single-stranded DNA-binding protein [Anaerolineales bacterium]